MPTTCPQIEKQPRVKKLCGKLEALRERIGNAEVKIADAEADLTEAAAAAHELEAAAEIGEANAKELKAARAARTKAQNAVEAVRDDVNLPAKRRAEERLEDRVHTAREETRERLVSEIAEKGHETAPELLAACAQLFALANQQAGLVQQLHKLGVTGMGVSEVSALLANGQHLTLDKIKPANLNPFFAAAAAAGYEDDLPEDAWEWPNFKGDVRKAKERAAR